MTDRSFTLAGYRSLLDRFAALKYSPAGFLDAEVGDRKLYLRHDVDISLASALVIAEAEQAMGWWSTYYLLVTSEFYNVSSAAARRDIRRIVEAGHRVGLHFDASVYGMAEAIPKERLEQAAVREIEILSDATGAPVESVSFHRPVAQFQGMAGSFAGVPHSYQPRFFSDIDYCSDSGGSWAHGHPLDRAAMGRGDSMQLLTHPIWWSGEIEQAVPDRVDTELAARTHFLRAELGRNIKPYAAHLDGKGS